MIKETSIFGIRTDLICILLVLFACYLSYSSIFSHPFTDYDDFRIILDRIESYDGITLSTIKKLFYEEFPREEPLLMRDISYLINAQLFGPLNPSGYLLGNFLLHIVVCYLVYYLSLSLFNNNVFVALLSAIFFAIHPIHVESIAWISSRKDSLYTVFYLVSFIFYTKQFPLKPNVSSTYLYIWSTVTFIFALFSKSAAISFLPLVLCYRFILAREYKPKLSEIIYLVGLLAITLLYISWYTGVLREYGILKSSKEFIERDWIVWLLSSFSYIFFYLGKLISPVHSAIFYAYPASVNLYTNISYVLASTIVIILILGSFLLFLKFRCFQLAFLISFFFCGLLPYLEIAQVNIFVAERYVYLSSIPFCILLSFTIYKAYILLSNSKTSQALLVVAVIFISLVWTYKTRQFCKIWASTESFWQNNIAVSPQRIEPYSGLMRHYLKNALYSDSQSMRLEYLDKCRTIGMKAIAKFCPTHKNCHANLWQVVDAMASLEWSAKNYEKADDLFKSTISIQPNMVEPRFSYAGFLYERGRYEESIEQVNKLKPNINPYKHSEIINIIKYTLEPNLEKAIQTRAHHE